MKKKTFIFDFDSTIFPGETLDEIIQLSLANDKLLEKKRAEITAICDLGMTGKISMAASLKRRLAIAAPTKKVIENYVAYNAQRIDAEIIQLLNFLQQSGHSVFVVSGGFEDWIRPMMAGILPPENIQANKILDDNQPMIFENIIQRDKEKIIKELVAERKLTETEITMIGDGATDFRVYERKITSSFVGAFYYTQPGSRDAVIDKIIKSEQSLFYTLTSFIQFIHEVIK